MSDPGLMTPAGGSTVRHADRPAVRRRTLWEEGRQPGRELVTLGVAVALSVTVAELALTSRVGPLFDLCFVGLCLALALAVRPADFFTVGVLPPLLMTTVFVLVGATMPEVVAHPADGVVQAVVTALSDHSAALVTGYLLCLAVLWLRERVARRGRLH